MSSPADDLDEAADALYGLPPADFTGARNDRAARAGGDLGTRIKRLRKPSVAAWAVNLLVRDGQLAEAVALSQALRDAQDDLDAVELAALGRQRRALVAGLARRAAELADHAGSALSAAAVTEVETTVNAAVVDAAVGAAVLTGRLVRTVPSGTEPSALAEAVAGSIPGASEAPPRNEVSARRSRKAAEAAARAADRAVTDAERELARIDGRRDAAHAEAEELRARVEFLRAETERATRDADRAEALEADAVAARADAADRVRLARAEAERAHAMIDDPGAGG